MAFDDSPEWGSASVLGPWAAYRFYGDKAELERNYPAMQAVCEVSGGQGGRTGLWRMGWGTGTTLGRSRRGYRKNTSLGVTGTLMLYEDAVAMAKIAALLGHAEDAAGYAALAEREKDGVQREVLGRGGGVVRPRQPDGECDAAGAGDCAGGAAGGGAAKHVIADIRCA